MIKRMNIISKAAVLTWLMIYFSGSNAQNPVISTNYGPVEGFYNETSGVTVFLGIPFAKPPVDSLRFKRPEVPDPWIYTYDATQPPTKCPTHGATEYYDSVLSVNPDFEVSQDEDCLNLNVYYPGDISETANAKTVMVWIHGGGYIYGSASEYDPSVLAVTQDVIVVTINYRLGFLGFANTPDGIIPGNIGLFDQNMALKWVQANIAAFGGDQNMVTIFGESAGADSVLNHVVSPQSNGLFRRAIIQSTYSTIKFNSIEKYDTFKQIVSSNWNCETTTSTSILNCLQDLTLGELDSIEANDDFNVYIGFPIVIDGVFLTDDPMVLLQKGLYNQSIDIMLGFTGDDGDVILNNYEDFGDLVSYGVSDVTTALNIIKSAWFYLFGTPFDQSLNGDIVLNRIQSFYFDGLTDALDIARALLDVFTDYSFGFVNIKISNYIASHNGNIYLYYFDYRSDALVLDPSIQSSIQLSALHAEDLLYMFGTGLIYFDGQEAVISFSMMKAWGEFAKTGMPMYFDNDFNTATWEPYTTMQKRFFHIDSTLTDASGKVALTDEMINYYVFWQEMSNTDEISSRSSQHSLSKLLGVCSITLLCLFMEYFY